jgi:hypothetical protein
MSAVVWQRSTNIFLIFVDKYKNSSHNYLGLPEQIIKRDPNGNVIIY